MSATMTFANRYISNTKEAVLHWKDRENNVLSVADSAAGIVYTGQNVQLTSPLYNAAASQLGNAGNKAWAHNWDIYSSKYQRCRVRKVEVTCEFYIEQDFFYENEETKFVSLVSNSDYYIVGMFLTETLATPLANQFNWEQLKRVGNCVYRRYVKNVSGPLRVTGMVSIPGALQYQSLSDITTRVYPTANIGTNQARVIASYPNIGNLYMTMFVVPQTRTLGPSTPVQVNYRMSTKKHVTFTRPISDIYQTYSLLQYPPYSTALPAGFEPRSDIDPHNEQQNARLTDLENRMDLDDIEDANAEGYHAQLDQMDTDQNVRLDDIEADQILQDQNTATQVSILNDSIDDNTTLIQQHAALEGKQAH